MGDDSWGWAVSGQGLKSLSNVVGSLNRRRWGRGVGGGPGWLSRSRWNGLGDSAWAVSDGQGGWLGDRVGIGAMRQGSWCWAVCGQSSNSLGVVQSGCILNWNGSARRKYWWGVLGWLGCGCVLNWNRRCRWEYWRSVLGWLGGARWRSAWNDRGLADGTWAVYLQVRYIKPPKLGLRTCQ